MDSYLLDTTVIIDYLRGKVEIVELLKKLFSYGAALGCCHINFIEIYAGIREKEIKVTEEFLYSLDYYDITQTTAKQAGEYIKFYREKGITLSLSDVVIASIAITNNLILLTDNTKHYPMPDLKIILPENLNIPIENKGKL